MRTWNVTIDPTARAVKLLVTDPETNEVLKAALPPWPDHPRALLGLLEAVALWVGTPIGAAISAGPSLDPRCASALFGDGLWPADSALVRFHVLTPARRRRTIAGVGDFRGLRRLHGRWS